MSATVGARPSTATGNSGGAGQSGPHSSRSTQFSLAVWTALVAVAVATMLGAVVGAYMAAADGTNSVAQHAAVASDSGDLYFSLSDLDAEAARLVLLGSGADPATGSLSLAGDQIATLTEYNARTEQADTDLRQLAASAGSPDQDAIAALTSGVTLYHQIADAAIALDQTAPSTVPDTMGASAGQPTEPAIGYYARAASLMQSQLLPEAKALRDSKAKELSDSASSARLAGIIGASAAGVFGLLALVLALRAHSRLRRWFRRVANPGVLVAAVVSTGLTLGAVATFASTAADASKAGSHFTDYLAVTRTRAASYDVDGAVTRYLLMADTTTAPLQTALKSAASELANLGTSGATASRRWANVTDDTKGDITAIIRDIDGIPADGTAVGDPQKLSTALAKDTGTARGDEAYDFYYYDSALLTLSNERLDAFSSSMAAAYSDLSDWSWLPWLLAVGALVSLALGVRPRFAEYR